MVAHPRTVNLLRFVTGVEISAHALEWIVEHLHVGAIDTKNPTRGRVPVEVLKDAYPSLPVR